MSVVTVVASSSAAGRAGRGPAPMVIREQGSFAVGGTVVASSGTYDAINRDIPATPIANPGQDGWRARLAMARRWRDVVNRHGGDVTVVHLPEVGVRGNTHFPFSDLNDVTVADLMSRYLADKRLDGWAPAR